MNTGNACPEQLPPPACQQHQCSPARLAAMLRQCRARGGDGCPCAYEFQCHVPTLELTAKIEGERVEAARKKAAMRERREGKR